MSEGKGRCIYYDTAVVLVGFGCWVPGKLFYAFRGLLAFCCFIMFLVVDTHATRKSDGKRRTSTVVALAYYLKKIHTSTC